MQRKTVQRGGHQELRQLRKELRQREKRAIWETLQSAQLVFATCVGADDRSLQALAEKGQPFDVVCIDEAAQAMEVLVIQYSSTLDNKPSISSALLIRVYACFIAVIRYFICLGSLLDSSFTWSSLDFSWRSFAITTDN